MKRLSTLIILAAFGTLTFSGCGTSKASTTGSVAGTVAKTVATAVGLILLSKIIKNVLGTLGGTTTFASLASNQTTPEAFAETTKLNSFASNNLLKTALQVIVAEKYQIPLNTVTSNYNNLTTVGDLATFIGQNASVKALNAIK